MAEVRLGILDWDGTCVIGSEPIMYEGYRLALEAVNVPFQKDELIPRLISRWGHSHHEQLYMLLEEGGVTDPSAHQEAVANWESFTVPKMKELLEVAEGCVEILEKLKKNGRMVLALNTAISHRILTEEIMPAVSFDPNHFDHIVAADTRGPDCRPKPHPDINKRLMAKVDVSPEETFAVGDSEVDVESAKKAGIKHIIVVRTGQLTLEAAKKMGVPESNIIPTIGFMEPVLEDIKNS